MSALELASEAGVAVPGADAALFRAVAEHAREGLIVLDPDLSARFGNGAAAELTGVEPSGGDGSDLARRLHPDDRPLLADVAAALAGTGRASDPLPLRFATPGDEGWRHVEAVCRDLTAEPAVGGLLLTLRDASDRRRLEDQLRQSQKMEAVGRLAGGIAHDFNNLLLAIHGNLFFVADELEEGSGARRDLDEAMKAAERAAALTRQLLAFSRRNVVERKDVVLNSVVERIQPMLSRLLRVGVRLRTRLAADLWSVSVDPAQMEQVIMNLVVNAQDAMPHGGTVSIDTRNVTLGADYGAPRGVEARGPHVLLSVTDTGTGMSPEVQERAFEPFFTTKEEGKGTGFGLSTVYGIVRQHDGHAAIYSEEGHGTTVKVYLPRVAGVEEPAEPGEEPILPEARGGETVLVAEDEDGVRRVVERIARRQGYRVLSASSGTEALRIAQRHDGPLHLLLTDVVMPDVAGPELAEALRMMRPGIKVLFMSGYTESSMLERGAGAGGHAFLDKPFTSQALARALRDVLDGTRTY